MFLGSRGTIRRSVSSPEAHETHRSFPIRNFSTQCQQLYESCYHWNEVRHKGLAARLLVGEPERERNLTEQIWANAETQIRLRESRSSALDRDIPKQYRYQCSSANLLHLLRAYTRLSHTARAGGQRCCVCAAGLYCMQVLMQLVLRFPH